MSKIYDKYGKEIEIGDWLRDLNTEYLPPYVVTNINNGKVYGNIPVNNIYDKQINLENVKIVQKAGF